MYVPPMFEELDIAVLHALVRAHPLGAWVATTDGQLTANHIPFLLDADRGPCGTLVGHVSRANDIWQKCSREQQSLVIFQGPQHYITPSWYASKREHGKTVPTWNYAVVHASGVPRIIEDTAWLLTHVTALVERHESTRKEPWHVTDAPADYIAAQLRGIVGVEIPINSLTGKWKTSQNRPAADQEGTAEGLREIGSEGAAAMAAIVERGERREGRRERGGRTD